MRMSKSVFIALAGLAAVSCGRARTDEGSALRSDQTQQIVQQSNGDTKRATVMTMSFTKWGDVIMVDAGIIKSAEGKCAFTAPFKADTSTSWKPFQIYWSIFDNAADARNGTTISGIFSETDVADSTKLQKPDGVKPHGYAYLSEQSAKLVGLTEPETSPDGSEMKTILTIAGHKSALRTSVAAVEGGCAVTTVSCRGGAECFTGGAFVPTGNIHVTQNPFGIPRAIEQQTQLKVDTVK
jgi:hypothetical protein